MNFTNNLETTITCLVLIILSIVFMYIIYRMLDYQRNPVKYREGFDSTGNCSITDLKNNITKLKEQVEGTVDISKNKSDLEDVITDVYDIVNYKIIASLCKSKDPSNNTNLMQINVLMDNAAGLQRLMKWLDGKSGSSGGGGGMFG